MTEQMLFNRNEPIFGKAIEQPSQELIKNTLGLHNASLEDALKYGGELTRQAIGSMNLTFSKKYITVDTKIHMLLPNMCPAIPGWHTDGVPRGVELDPTSKGKPNIQSQETLDSPIFHLLVTGESCLTQFIKERDVILNVPKEPDTILYKMVSQQVQEKVKNGELTSYEAPSCTPVMWDWWELHTGVPAKKHEWRFLIRVTESDIVKPKTDLREIIRTQQQGYMPLDFGW
ncbi:hypothetical protein PDQ75_25010 [Bacillus cereus group sp. Bc015]|uniref:hypothetical protein n=1 Tax=Bacillus cereus group sp. Bc015 TaxID=3018123 RepID=UPI0022E6091D|nr:hypothetical protein [Bacillus cereus group sp. Bc015]MDA2738417.1 hypothetical protein [Bacillus cereus group sp. Bc015]